jgi:L-alanine-DL-glutamate epimerase-like enolase superfamily enzyme
MRIREIVVDHFAVPLPVVLSDSTHGDIATFALVTARVRGEDGLEGLGYTYTVGNIGGDAVRSVAAHDLAPVLVGEDPRRIEALWQRMWWHVHFVGRGGIAAFAIAALDVALHDMNARRAEEPLWRFLGGHDPVVRAYAGGIDLQFTLEALLDQARGFQQQGFRAIKMKVGRDRLREDVERVAAMRDFLGPDFALLADANMRWSVSEAICAARAFAPHGLEWLEEPTIPDDVTGHARIAREGGVPIATGENLHSIYEFRQMIDHGAVSFPEPDLAALGGVTPWLKVARMAEAANLPVTSHGVHDLHVHLLAAVPNASYLEAHGFGLERFVQHPLGIVDGVATAPDRPGHGVALDFDALEPHRVGARTVVS